MKTPTLRKFALMVLCIIFATKISAQTSLDQLFTGGSLPDGWSATEEVFTYDATNGATVAANASGTLTAPSIDISGYTNIPTLELGSCVIPDGGRMLLKWSDGTDEYTFAILPGSFSGTKKMILPDEALVSNFILSVVLENTNGTSPMSLINIKVFDEAPVPSVVTVTVADGTNTNGNIPIYLYAYKTFTKSQIIYLDNDINSLKGKTINKMSFHSSTESGTWPEVVTVSIGITSSNNLASNFASDELTNVYSGSLGLTNGVMEIVFNEGYTYPASGGNLLVQFSKATSPTFHNATNFYGRTTGSNYLSRYVYGTYQNLGGESNFQPKVSFEYENVSSCQIPTNLVMTSSSSNSASFSWSGSAGSYNIAYSSDNGTHYTTVYGLNGSSSTINGLETNVGYIAKIQSDCGDGDLSDWSAPVSFATECEPDAVIPYSEGFESNDVFTTGCWKRHVVETGSGYGEDPAINHIVINDQQPLHDGSYTLSCLSNYVKSGSQLRAVIKPLDLSQTQGVSMSFWWYQWQSGNATVQLQYSTDGTSWTNVDAPVSVAASSGTEGWKQLFYDIPQLAGQSKAYIGFLFTADYSKQCYIDDLNINTISAYRMPVNVAYGSAASNSITMTCNAPIEATGAQVKTSEAGEPVNAAYTYENNTATYTVSGLTADTYYNIWTRLCYGGDNYSQWTNNSIYARTLNNNTVISAMSISGGQQIGQTVKDDVNHTINMVLNAEYAANLTNLVLNFTLADNNAVLKVGDAIQQSGVTANDFTNPVTYTVYAEDPAVTQNWTVTVEVESCPQPSNLAVNPNTKTTATASWTDRTDPNSGNFQYVLSQTALDETALAVETPINISGTGIESKDLTDLTPETTYYFYLRNNCGEGQQSQYIGAQFTMPDACTTPVNLTCSNLSHNAVTLSWESVEYGDETQWKVRYWSQYQNENEATILGPTDRNPYILTGLATNSSYYAQVQAYCSESSQSDWSSPVYFTTTETPPSCSELQTGTGEITDVPLFNYWGGEYALQIFTKAELTAMGYSEGPITGISFHLKTLGDTQSNCCEKTCTIWMGNTSKSSFTSNSDWIASGLTQVFNPVVKSFSPAESWIDFSFDNSFTWDGTSNLVVATLFVSTGHYTSYTFYGGNASFNSTIYCYRDGTDFTVTNGVPNGTNNGLTTNRANIQFCFEPSACPAVNHFTASDLTSNSANIQWYPAGSENEWYFYLSETQIENPNSDPSPITVYETISNYPAKELTGLTKDKQYFVYIKTDCASAKWAEFTFTTLPTCSVPELTVGTPEAYSVTLSCAEGEYGTAGSYEYQYRINGETEWQTAAGTESSITLTGLYAMTAYECRAKSVCGEGDESQYTGVQSFTTSCGVYARLPFVEDFGTNSLTRNCWSTEDGFLQFDNWTSNYSSNLNSENANNSLYSPEITLPSAPQQLSWKVNSSNADYKVYITEGDVTNINLGNLTPVYTERLTQDNQERFADISTYAGKTVRVLFYHELVSPDTYSTLYLDDVSINELPSCPKPFALVANDPSWNHVSLSWHIGGSETVWNVCATPTAISAEYPDPTANEGAVTVTANTNSNYLFEELSGNTNYYVYVRAVCGESTYSEWSQSATFRTKCVPESVLPVVENFDSYDYDLAPFNDGCWMRQIGSAGSGDGSAPNINNIYLSGNKTHSGKYSLYFGITWMVLGSELRAVAPLLDLSSQSNGASVSFWWLHNENDSNAPDKLQMQYSTDGTTWTNVGNPIMRYMENSGQDGTWYKYTVEIPQLANQQTAYVGFTIVGGHGNYSVCCIDDIEIKAGNSCLMPADFAMTQGSLTSNSAAFSMTALGGEPQGLQVKYSSDGEGENVNANDWSFNSENNSIDFTINNLVANTNYTVWSRLSCGNDDYSEWTASSVNFRTLNIDTDITSMELAGTGYQLGQTVIDNENHTVNMVLDADYVNQLSYLAVNFQLDDANAIAKVGGNVVTSGSEFDFSNNGSIAFTVYAEDRAISQEWTVTVTVETCPIPKNLVVDNIGRRTATASWTPRGATEWNLVITNDNDEEVLNTTTDASSYNITGLDRETDYTVKVRAVCGNNEYSDWCTYDFTTEGIGGGDCGTECSNTIDMSNNSVTVTPGNLICYYDSGGQGGSMANASSTSYANNYYSTAYTQTFTSDGPITVNFTLFNTENDYDKLFIYDGNNSEGTPLTTLTGNIGSNLTGYSYTSTSNSLTFKFTCDGSWNAAGWEATICCPAIPVTCPAPSDVLGILTGDGISTASASWTAPDGEIDYPTGHYDLILSTTSITEFASVTITHPDIEGSSKDFTGLEGDTDYYVYVRYRCDGDPIQNASEWVGGYVFTTNPACPKPTNLVYEFTSTTSATISWSYDQSYNYNFEYILATEYYDDATLETMTPTTGITATTVTFTELSNGQYYYFYLRNDCGNTGANPYTRLTFTAPASCPAPITLAASNVGANTATLSWQSGVFGEETEWQIYYSKDYSSPYYPTADGQFLTVTETSQLIWGLTAGTQYSFYVKANCSNDDQSAWTGPEYFTTETVDPTCGEFNNTSSAGFLVANNSNNYAWSQQIFTATELTNAGLTAGKITNLYVQYSWTYGDVVRSMQVYIGHIGVKTSFDNNKDWFDLTTLKKVYEGTTTFNNSNTWFEFVFNTQTDFIWDGTSNIVVAFVDCTGSSDSNGKNRFSQHNSESNRTLYKDAVNQIDASLQGTLYSTRANIKFCSLNGCPVIANLSASNLTATTAHISWTPGGSETDWNVIVSETEITDFEGVGNQTVSTPWYDTSELNGETLYYVYVKPACADDYSSSITFTTACSTEQTTALHAGWNWFSTYVNQANGTGLQQLENSLGANGSQIKSQNNGFIQYVEGSWNGSLTALSNEGMFMINTTAPVDVTLSGCTRDNANCPISINAGWNWIGYPNSSSDALYHAMSGLYDGPQNGDIIKSRQGFASYYSAYQIWAGSLSQMTPGQGYMYYRVNGIGTTLTYPEPEQGRGDIAENLPETSWQASQYQYAGSMTMIADVVIDGITQQNDIVEVGAFCGDELRGSGRAIYIPALGSYRLFLMIYGQDNDNITFKLYDDASRGASDMVCKNSVRFVTDINMGSIETPYQLLFGNSYNIVIEADSEEMNIFPVPAKKTDKITMTFNLSPEELDGILVEIYNTYGARIESFRAYEQPVKIDGISESGVYTVKVILGTGKQLTGKIIIM